MANLADKFQNILISDKNKYSVEVSPGKDLDFDLLSELKPRFCSVTWRVKSENDYLENVENSTPLLLAEKLQQRGHDVILNIPGKHFCKDNVLTILNKARNIGVRGIFAIQGGEFLHNIFTLRISQILCTVFLIYMKHLMFKT